MKRYVINPLLRLCRQPSFVVCVLILAVCAGGLRVGAERFKWKFRKESISLRKGLDELDLNKLGPYRLIEKYTIRDEIIEELGTREYIQWLMEDTSVDARVLTHEIQCGWYPCLSPIIRAIPIRYLMCLMSVTWAEAARWTVEEIQRSWYSMAELSGMNFPYAS